MLITTKNNLLLKKSKNGVYREALTMEANGSIFEAFKSTNGSMKAQLFFVKTCLLFEL